ncbi:MAG: DUF4026 domain-containing protein, partial [Planctomycetota bacterium]
DLPEQEPTNLLVLWPPEQVPSASDVHEALARVIGPDLRTYHGPAPDDPDVQWSTLVEIADGRRLILWSEPAQPIAARELDDRLAHACRWVVGVQALLDPEDPLTSFLNLLRLLAGAFPDAPAVLDVNTTRWHRRPALDELLADDSIESPADTLWLIHVVQAKRNDPPEQTVAWLHTHGLWRCGRPELEMLDVPADEAAVAAELLSGIADLLLDDTLPPPGAPFEIGDKLEVTFQPLMQMIDGLDPQALGSTADRQDDEAHGGVRAVICDAPSDGSKQPRSTWPEAVARRLRRGEALLYCTARATQRQAKIARKTWPQLAEAFALASEPTDGPHLAAGWSLLIKAPIGGTADARTPREHLWFDARRFEADRAEAALLNRPRSTAGVEPADLIWIDRDGVSDWYVKAPFGSFGPDDAAALSEAIKQGRGGPGA